MLCSLVNTARSIDIKDSAFNLGQPLFFEIPRIPQSNLYFYSSILIDKGNRLFITNEHDFFIYDGVNFQHIKSADNPIAVYDGENRIAIAGKRFLSLLTLNSSGEYNIQRIIDTSTLGFNYQITSIGFNSDNSIYFSTGFKLWTYKEKPIPIDSCSQRITIYKTSKGLIFYSKNKGFYSIENKTINYLNDKKNFPADEILNVVAVQNDQIAITQRYPWFYSIHGKKNGTDCLKQHFSPNEKILRVFTSGLYFFVTTSSSHLLMFDDKGNLISSLSDFGTFNADLPIDISTTDNINFFAITPTQIFRFINPSMVQMFDARENLKGVVKSAKRVGEKIYAATSSGVFVANNDDPIKKFDLIAEGEFHDLYLYKNHLFATGANGLFLIKGNLIEKVFQTSLEFTKTFFLKSYHKAFFLNPQGFYYTNLDSPSDHIEFRNEGNLSFSNFYNSDSLLLIKTENDRWFLSKPENDNFILKPLSGNQAIMDADTFSLFNDQLGIKENSGFKTIIGRSFSNQTVINNIGGLHPNYQTLIVKRKEEKQLLQSNSIFALERAFKINAAFLDSDSITWISTNKGLIKVSNAYSKFFQHGKPNIIVFSTSSSYKGVKSILYNGYAQQTNISSTYFRVKLGCVFEVNLSGVGNNEWNNLMYSYKSDDNNSHWSTWTADRKFILDEQTYGRHSYFFKARDLNGNESPVLKISLLVIPKFFQTPFTFIVLIILVLLAIYTVYVWRNYSYALERFKLEGIINRRTEELVKEKEKTDNLLARVLPRETATELKETGKVNNQKFNMVTVLFSDIQGFTKITDDLNPENLIDQLDKFFLYFDSVVDKYKIEKIKTIGDAYMCAGGIPHKNRTNPIEVVLAALEMLYFMREINLEHNPGQDIWDLRIGIDTGPVIAGVVGRNKLSYDIWGTTVNTASRMESSGEVGKINISGNTHIFVQDYFICTYRGKMPIKNKGDIEMYFVEGIKPMLASNLEVFRPNNDFQLQLQFLRFGDLEEFILEKLEKGLPKNLYYHNLKHTVDVYTQVELIGRSEDVTLEEQLLLQTAALFHDAGHLIDYDTHEEMGVKLAREILPEYQYSERQIEIISDLIMITKLPPKPKNLLEAIMCDADLDYLGRTDFIPVSNMLYKELHEHGRIGTIQEWNEMQIKFIEKHQYFTNTARRLRNVNKNSQLDNIKKWIEKNKL